MHTISIIDDNATRANYFERIIKRENYKVHIAKTQEETSALLKNHNLSLVILSSQMPDNTSIAILKEIRKKFSQNELPVAIIIERENKLAEDEFLENGTSCIFDLPITENSLKLRVRNLLQIRETAIHLKLQIQQQKNIFENSPIPSLLIDDTGVVRNVNKSAFQLFNVEGELSYSVFCGEMFNCYNALHNIGKCGTMDVCSLCLIRNSINTSFKTKKNVSICEGKFNIHINNEQQERILIVTTTYIQDVSANLALLNFEDVTDLRKSQQIIAQKNTELTEINVELQAQKEELTQITEKLEESNQFTSQIIQSAQEGIVVYDKNLRYMVWNPFMKKITGLSSSQVIGKHAIELFPFLQEAGIIDNYKKVLNGEIVVADDFPFHVEKTGIRGWASETSAPLRNVKGEIIGVIAIVYDITQRKKYEEQLKEKTEEIETQNEELQSTNEKLTVVNEQIEESEAKYKELFDANADSITIFRINPDGTPSNILEMNDSVSKLTGYTKEEIYNMNPSDFEVNPTKERVQKRIEDLQAKGFTHFEMILKHKDGHDINVEVKAVVINYKNKPALMNILRDITERKKAEFKIAKQTSELQELNATKDKFMSILAHDLKNPFNSLIGFSQLLSINIDKYNKDKIKQFADAINNTSNNTYKLLENLLEWSRSQQGKIPFNPSNITANSVVADCMALLSNQAKAKKIEIIKDIPDDIVVFADRDMFNTILRNLITNAIKYTPLSGKIILSAKPNHANVEFAVKDSGIGMSEKTKNSLFKIGKIQSQEGTAGEVGTGFGLMLCKEFIVQHSGKIWVESEEGKGSDFKFTLPFDYSLLFTEKNI